MKNKLFLTFVACICFMLDVHAQAPGLIITGINPTFSKGTINTEVLTEIIQQKQEEVKLKVFKNTIIKEFNKSQHTKNLNNFATYYYMYNVMDVLTSGKNKTFITQQLMKSSAEFAYIYGFALYVKEETHKDNKTIDSKNYFQQVQVQYKDNRIKAEPDNVKDFNLLMDYCFFKLLEYQNNTNHKTNNFRFQKDSTDNEFKIWFNNDNSFLQLPESERGKFESQYTKIDDLLNKYIKTESIGITNISDLDSFLCNLKKTDYKNFELTENQFNGLKFLLNSFMKVAKNQYKNDVVAKVINFLMENTFVDFVDASGQKVKSDSINKGYIFVDVEAMIASIYQAFSNLDKKGTSVYFQPYFSIGTNYASFLGQNKLNQGQNLQNLYFASEKIGVMWKIWNWKYTHSFNAGDNYGYYFKNNRYWSSPPKVTTLSNVYLTLYASGLLYNLVPVTSNTNFNYPILGTNVGFTFFNGLSTSIGLSTPIINKEIKKENAFFNVGIDVPIIEYLAALKKNKN